MKKFNLKTATTTITLDGTAFRVDWLQPRHEVPKLLQLSQFKAGRSTTKGQTKPQQ
jgi:hypothetical protein